MMSDSFDPSNEHLTETQKDNLRFVGRIVELGTQKIRVKSVISQCSLGYVFSVEDTSNGDEYALKRLIATDDEANKSVLHQIRYLKTLSGHPNIIQFFSATSIEKEKSGHGKREFLILTELCTGGSLIDALQTYSKALPRELVGRIFYHVCCAVKHMHAQNPPIVYRDLKMEDLHIGADGFIKLCDFVSATTKAYHPDSSWTEIQHSLVKDEMSRSTTPKYRAPEIRDSDSNFPIYHAMDIWNLGCILFLLCFNKFPLEDFEEIHLAKYIIPSSCEYEAFHDLIKGTLQLNPNDRPTIFDVLERLENIADVWSIDIKSPVNFQQQTRSSNQGNPSKRPVKDDLQAAQITGKPWDNQVILQKFFTLLYSDNTYDNERGIEMVENWESRFTDIPFVVSCTASLTSAVIRDNFTRQNIIEVVNKENIRSLYTIGIARFVNVTDETAKELSFKKKFHGAIAADVLGFPPDVINKRNESVHSKNRPKLEDLREGALKAKHWIRMNLWSEDYSSSKEPEHRARINNSLSEFFTLRYCLLVENLMPNEIILKLNEQKSVLMTIEKQLQEHEKLFFEIFISPNFFLRDAFGLESFKEADCEVPKLLVNIWHPLIELIIKTNVLQQFLVFLLEYDHLMFGNVKKIASRWEAFFINEDSLFRNFLINIPIHKWSSVNWMRVMASCVKESAFLLPEKIEDFSVMEERKKKILMIIFDVKVLRRFPKKYTGCQQAYDVPPLKYIKSDLNSEEEREFVIQIGNKEIDWAYTPLYLVFKPQKET